jgi:hypothetical protein
MYPQRLLGRKKAPALIAQPLAHLPVLGDLVAQPVVLPREALGAPEGARELGLGLGLRGVRGHVQRERVLGREAVGAPGLEAAEAPGLRLRL